LSLYQTSHWYVFGARLGREFLSGVKTREKLLFDPQLTLVKVVEIIKSESQTYC
jgi:hypothetical protein